MRKRLKRPLPSLSRLEFEAGLVVVRGPFLVDAVSISLCHWISFLQLEGVTRFDQQPPSSIMIIMFIKAAASSASRPWMIV